MISEDKVKIARHNFILASKEFGFDYISPFVLTDGIEAFGYISINGRKNGVVISLTAPPDFQTDSRISDSCRKMDFLYSFLNIELLTGAYKSSYFRELLRDWSMY